MENNNEKEQGNLQEITQHQEKVIETPVFIIFAEYLGYISRFNEIAIKWCDGEVPEDYIQKLMIMEAKTIFRQMKKDYGLDTIQFWYDTYRPVILGEYEEKLAKLIPVESEA